MKILHHHGKNKAFTLAETIIVLFVSVNVLLILSVYHYRSITTLNEQLFISSYRRLLKLTQLKALVEKRGQTLFYNDLHYSVNSHPFAEVTLPLPKTFISYINFPITFSSVGSTKARTLGFRTPTYRYYFVFQIGRGHFRYEEECIYAH